MAVLKETVPFTYSEIYSEIVERLIAKGYDAPYEGSNTSVISSTLAYIISMLGYNVSANINESLLTLATKRKNVVQDARILSYEPRTAQSTILEITLEFFRAGFFKIPKYSTFSINNFTYNYFGNDLEIRVEKVGETKKIQVKEGKLLKYTDYPDILCYKIDEKMQYIDIPFRDVEHDGLEPYVTFFDGYGQVADNVLFSRASVNAVDINDNVKHEYFRRDDLNTGNCRIYFQLGTAGTRLPPNSRVNLNVLRTSGSAAYYKGLESAKVEGVPGSFCKIINSGHNQPKVIQQAQDAETIESIKQNAPLFFNSACRAVTVHDYVAIVGSHSSVKNVLVWGGEDDYPTVPGNIFFSAEPKRKPAIFNVYQKVQTNNAFVYKKESSIDNKGTKLDGEDSTFQYIFNPDYKDIQTMFLNDGEVVTAEFNEKRQLKNPGIFDLVNSRNLPALKNNLKNPVYINIDLEVKIKQYPFGNPKSEVRKRIYAKIREKIGEMEKFEGEYIHSNLVRYLDSELGSGHGLEVNPYFTVTLHAKNRTLQFTENKEFSKVNCFYSKKYNERTRNLAVTLYFSIYSEMGDEVQIYFNKDGLEYVKEEFFTYKLTSEDVAQGGKTLLFYDPGFNQDSIKVKLRPYDGLTPLTGRDINLYNLSNKAIFFYVKVGVELSNIKVVLPRYVRVGDEVKISRLYGVQRGESDLINVVISQSHINDGYIMTDDINRASYAGLVKPTDYKVVYTCNKYDLISEDDEPNEKGLLPNQVAGKACSTFEQAKQLTETQNKVFSDTETTNLYYNCYDADDGTIYVRVWLPATAKSQDVIEIDYAGDNTLTILTTAMVNKKIIDIKVEPKQLNISKILYYGEEPSINILPASSETKNELRPLENDNVKFSQAIYENIVEYTPSTTFDRRIQIKESKGITFFINYVNKFDVRNLIANYDAEKCEISVNIPEKSPLKFEEPYITLSNYRKPSVLSFSLEVQIKRGELLQTTQIIYCKEPEEKLTTDEGPGGAYVYLDLPVESLFDYKGALITQNLPAISLVTFKDGDGEMNFEELWELGKERPQIDYNNLKVNNVIYVDTSITNESVSRILTFHTDLENFNNLDLRNVGFIRFPIFASDGQNDELVGSYALMNTRNPYIRIKFRNDVFPDERVREFSLSYPSNNFKLIRNSIFRLRSVVFDDELDNRFVRVMQRSGAYIPSPQASATPSSTSSSSSTTTSSSPESDSQSQSRDGED